ncbi:MAG: putative quinol monooxygenase [Trebonia sp.]
MKSRKRRDDGWNEDRPDDGSRDNRANDSWAEDPWQGKDGYQQGTVAGYPGGGQANGAGYADQDRYGNQPPGHGAQGYDPRGCESGTPGAPPSPEPRQPGGGRPAAAGYARPRFPEAERYDFAGQDVQAYTGGRDADPAYGDQRQAGRQVNGQFGRPSPASGREFLSPEETPAGNDNWAESMRPYGRLTIFTLLDDKAAEFDRLAERAAEGVRMAEADTLVYVIHVVPKAPMQRIIYEIYRDRAAFEEHERQPHMQRFAADRTSCVLATNVIDLRLKYAKVAGFGAPEAPPVPPVPPVPASGRETQVDWAPRAWGRGVPSAARPAGQRYPEGANGQYPGDRYPAGNGQSPAAGNGQYSAAGNGQYGNGQYGGGRHSGAANGRQRNMGPYPEPGNGRQPDGGPRPPENGAGYPDRNGSGTGRYGGS